MEQIANRALAKLKIMRLIERKRKERYQKRYAKKTTLVRKAS